MREEKVRSNKVSATYKRQIGGNVQFVLQYNSPANTTANTTFFERLAAFSADDDATLPVAGLVHTAFSATDIRAGVSHGKLFKEFTQQSITT